MQAAVVYHSGTSLSPSCSHSPLPCDGSQAHRIQLSLPAWSTNLIWYTDLFHDRSLRYMLAITSALSCEMELWANDCVSCVVSCAGQQTCLYIIHNYQLPYTVSTAPSLQREDPFYFLFIVAIHANKGIWRNWCNINLLLALKLTFPRRVGSAWIVVRYHILGFHALIIWLVAAPGAVILHRWSWPIVLNRLLDAPLEPEADRPKLELALRCARVRHPRGIYHTLRMCGCMLGETN